MVNTGVYNYINVLDKAADGAWKRNEAISNNLANINTPDYKRQDVSFQAELQHALKASKYTSLDKKIDELNEGNRLSRIEPRTYVDHSEYSYRLDGNNVDVDNENVELASNTIVYQAIVQSINSEFSNLKTVIK